MWLARSLGKTVCVHALFTGHAQKRTLPVVLADGPGPVDPLRTEHGGSCWRQTGPGLRSRLQGPGPSVQRHPVPRSPGAWCLNAMLPPPHLGGPWSSDHLPDG